jgi:prepilin-type N-terminal cleavage/methylation domain-containing protein
MLNKKRPGFTLIEIIPALLILAVASTVIIFLSLQVTSLVNSTKLKNEKVALAQQMLEQVRGYYQANGYAGLFDKANTSGQCYFYSETSKQLDWGSPTASCDPTGLPYARVKLILVGSQVRVEAAAKWSWKGASQIVTDQTSFYNY